MSGKAHSFRPSLETLLVSRLCKLLPEFLSEPRARWQVFREVGVGRSIADVVAVRQVRPIESSPVLSAGESIVLSRLRSTGPATKEALVAACGLNGRTTEIIDRLAAAHLVRLKRDGTVAPARGRPAGVALVAIEAKLVRWRDALAQATSYKRYADEAFVALPEAFGRVAIEHAAQFRLAGVGLLIVSRGRLRTVVAPARCRNHGWEREFVYSRLAISGEQLAGHSPGAASRGIATADHRRP